MQVATSAHEAPVAEGVVYRAVCQNPGCGHAFSLRITPKDLGLLSGTMACPRCRRRGGMLKRVGRLADKLFAAKLIFRETGVGPARSSPSEEGDLVSDIMGSGF